jgi:ribosomal protein L20A (L18A)
MEGIDKVINERVSFLKEQINPKNKPLVNRAFEIQIQTIRNADPKEVTLLILQKKKELENTKDMEAIERLYTELDALEWLQRQTMIWYPKLFLQTRKWLLWV